MAEPQKHITTGTGEDLGNCVYLQAHLAELEVVVGIPKTGVASQPGAKLFGNGREERLGVQIRFRLRDDGLTLVQLSKHREDRRQIAEGFVQATRLRMCAGPVSRPESIQNRMTRFVSDDVEGAAGEDSRQGRINRGIEVEEAK